MFLSNPSQTFVFFVYIVCSVQCFRIHRPHHRQELDRRDATTTALESSSIPSSSTGTEAAELIEDVTALEEGLSSLSQNVFEFLKEIDDRLHQQQALLESMLAVFTSVSETTSVATSAPSNTSSTEALLLPSTSSVEALASVFADTSSSLPVATACRRGGAGPLVSCSSVQSESDALSASTSPPRSRVTRTLTRTTYLQLSNTPTIQPIPFANTSSLDSLPGETKTSVPSLPTPTVYSSIGAEESGIDGSATSTDSDAVAASVPSPTSTSYTFKTSRQNNVAVYYGQTPTTKTGDLMALCSNDNVDIVVLAFVTSFFTNGGLPSASFGPSCKGSTTAQQLHTPGLQDCSDLAPEIVSCQALGKPVLVSLGGYYSNVTFASDTEAIQLAENLWDLFGAGTGLDASLRPFGRDITIDGFDLDNESKDPTSYGVFANALRALFASDTSKKYYLSAAPQCPRPDASIPLDAVALCDFVFVQYYNNPSCDLSSAGFESSFTAWSSELAAVNNETKLFIGAPAFEGAGSGYVEGAGLGHVVSLARQYYVSNLGGVMLWDGTEALANVDEYGVDYLVYAKGSLE